MPIAYNAYFLHNLHDHIGTLSIQGITAETLLAKYIKSQHNITYTNKKHNKKICYATFFLHT